MGLSGARWLQRSVTLPIGSAREQLRGAPASGTSAPASLPMHVPGHTRAPRHPAVDSPAWSSPGCRAPLPTAPSPLLSHPLCSPAPAAHHRPWRPQPLREHHPPGRGPKAHFCPQNPPQSCPSLNPFSQHDRFCAAPLVPAWLHQPNRSVHVVGLRRRLPKRRINAKGSSVLGLPKATAPLVPHTWTRSVCACVHTFISLSMQRARRSLELN